MPFQKGQSGNPKGRSKGTTKLDLLRRKWTAAGFLEFIDEYELRVWALKAARRKKDYAAVHRMVEDLKDRADGKAPQALHHLGPGGGVVEIQFVGLDGHSGQPGERVTRPSRGDGT